MVIVARIFLTEPWKRRLPHKADKALRMEEVPAFSAVMRRCNAETLHPQTAFAVVMRAAGN
jgi:hypothetical protein